MTSIGVKDSPYHGSISRPWTDASIDVDCRSCGSSLTGRREAVRWSRIKGVEFEVEVYRCGCGRGRHVRRPVR